MGDRPAYGCQQNEGTHQILGEDEQSEWHGVQDDA